MRKYIAITGEILFRIPCTDFGICQALSCLSFSRFVASYRVAEDSDLIVRPNRIPGLGKPSPRRLRVVQSNSFLKSASQLRPRTFPSIQDQRAVAPMTGVAGEAGVIRSPKQLASM